MTLLLLVYIDQALLGQLSQEEYDAHMRDCVRKADDLAGKGTLLGANKLEPPTTARTVRVREGRARVYDGPFAETKEVLAGYNLRPTPWRRRWNWPSSSRGRATARWRCARWATWTPSACAAAPRPGFTPRPARAG